MPASPQKSVEKVLSIEMTSVTGCQTRSSQRARPARWSPVLLAVASFGLLGPATGCKMMTDGQMAALKAEETRAKSVDSLSAVTAKKNTAQDEKRRQLQLKVDANRARGQRSEAFRAASHQYSLGQPAEALAALDAILARDEASVVAYQEARATGETAEFLTRTIEVESTDPAAPGPTSEEELIPPPMDHRERATILVVRGAALYDLGQTEEGIREFERAVALDPSNRAARINFGKLLFQKREWRGAIRAWKHEFDDGYRSAELLELMGQALYEMAVEEGDDSLLEAARAALLEALVVNPDDEGMLRWLGLIEYRTRRFDSAVRYFRAILARSPFDVGTMELIANCHIELGDLPHAADQLELIVRITKKDPTRICQTLSDIYRELNLPDRAALWLRRAFPDGNLPPEQRLALGYHLLSAEKLEDALTELDAIPSAATEFAEAQSVAAEIEVSLRRPSAAAARIEGVLDRLPGDGRIRLVAADLHMEEKRYLEAAKFYNLAAALPATKGRGLAGAAEAYYELGDLQKAMAYYQDALEAVPENAAYRSALDEIRSEAQFRTEVGQGTP